MSTTSILRSNNWNDASGSPVMQFGAGGSISFQSPFVPNAFAFAAWEGSNNRPTGVPIGSAGWNSANKRLEIYHGVDAELNELWAVFSGIEFNPDNE